MTVLSYGDLAAQKVSQRIAAPIASVTALAAISGKFAADGQRCTNTADGKEWIWSSTSTLTADNILVVGAATAGRWLLAPGFWDLSLPITFATADAAALLTVPTGALLYISRCYWEITADWTGGSSSAIGLSSSQTVGVDHSTKGDLHGGSAGNVAAALTATIGTSEGTIGTDMAAGPGVILRAASTVRFDRITSVFTAGTGNAHLCCQVLKNPGA